MHHPLLASATRLPPISSSSHGRRAKGRECTVGANAFIQLKAQLAQCLTPMVAVALLTLSHAAAPWTPKSQSTDRGLWSTAGTDCKQINARLKYQIPHRTKNCTDYNKPTMDNEQKYNPGWEPEDCIQTLGCLRWRSGQTFLYQSFSSVISNLIDPNKSQERLTPTDLLLWLPYEDRGLWEWFLTWKSGMKRVDKLCFPSLCRVI